MNESQALRYSAGGYYPRFLFHGSKYSILLESNVKLRLLIFRSDTYINVYATTVVIMKYLRIEDSVLTNVKAGCTS